MIMSDVLLWTLIIVGLMIVFNCYWLIAEALYPEMVERSREAYSQHLIRTALLGALIGIPMIVAGIAAFSLPGPFKLMGGALLLGPIILGLLGSTGLARQIGRGLASPADDSQPWRRVLRGGILLSFAFLMPFAGWFAILPATLFSGLGALAVAVRRKRQPQAVMESANPGIEVSA